MPTALPVAHSSIALGRSTLGALALTLTLTACGRDNGLSVVNVPPTAEILAPVDGDALLEGATVLLRGRLSDIDTRPELLRATWTVNGAQVCTTEAPAEDGVSTCEVTLTDVGAITIALEGLDTSNESASDAITVTVVENAPPTVSLEQPLAEGRFYAGIPVALAAVVADAEDAPQDLLIAWDADGAALTDAPESADSGGDVVGETLLLAEGTHTLTITVTDSGGKQGVDTTTLVVGPPNSAPTCAIFAPDADVVVAAGHPLTLTGQALDADVGPDELVASFTSDVDGALGAGTPDGDGVLSFDTSDLSVGAHTLTLLVEDEVGAQCTAEVAITVANTPPSAPILEMSPQAPLSTDALDVTIALPSWDAEDHPITYRYAWLKNGALQPTLTGTHIPAAATARGQVWTARVTPNDGYTDGEVAEVSVTIGNGPPSYVAAAITPTTATETSTLTCHATGGSDPDGDVVSAAFTWRVNGGDAGTGETLTGAAFNRGDSVTCAAIPQDGTTSGAPVASAAVVIGNTAPTVADVSVAPSPLSVATPARCAWTFTDLDPLDHDQSTVAWEVNGAPAGSGATLTATVVVGDTVRCTVTASDGTATGNSASASAQVVNAPPTAPELALDPAEPTTNDPLVIRFITPSVDPEGASVSYAVVWLRDGVVVPGQTGLELPADQTARGQVWTARVTASDGALTAAPVEAAVTVANSGPTLAAVVLSPSAADESTTLSCDAQGVADADGDVVALAYAWTVNGAPAGSTQTLDGAAFDRGDEVVCTIVASDGRVDAAPVASDPLTIANAAPVVSNVAFDPLVVTKYDHPVCTWEFADADPGDADHSTVAWTVNGAPAGTSATLSATLAAHDLIACTVTPNDGVGEGAPVTISADVGYGGPKVSSVVVDTLDGGPPMANDTLTCTYSGFWSPTGAADKSTFEWYVDGVLKASGNAYTGTPKLLNTFRRDQVVKCVITPKDGALVGEPMSDELTVLNAPPTTPALDLPATIKPGQGMSCGLATPSTDADGDPITYAFTWEYIAWGDTDGDGLSEEIDPLPNDFSYFDGDRDFSGSQSYRSWTYEYRNFNQGGANTWELATWYPTKSYWHGYTPYSMRPSGGDINAVFMHVGSLIAVSRTWTAPMSAPVHITGTANMRYPTIPTGAPEIALEGRGISWRHVFDYRVPAVAPFSVKTDLTQGDKVRLNASVGPQWSDDFVTTEQIFISSPTDDLDGDGVIDPDDVCQYGDDAVDLDDNGTPDACDSGWLLYTDATTGALSSSVPASAVSTHDTWRCRVVASDGTDYSAAAFASVRSIP